MSLVINNNLMAANTARNLNAHYGRLATSTQRLSSGLRINSAADDAAGLAIRELQRADIAALQQGARNANDAVSMIQVADGSLSIIDEKLIRMRELAEQAATGTYDSTQRLMIESEYQAMASEITRIANATDFNGIKLLDGTLKGEHDGSGLTSTGQMKIHFGTGNDSAEDYYYVEIGECTSQAFGIGNASTWQDVQQRAIQSFRTSLASQIKNDASLTAEEKSELLGQINENVTLLENALNHATDPTTAFLHFTGDDEAFFPGNPSLREKYMAAVSDAQKEFDSVGWPTTSQEILEKITRAMASVDKPDFTVLYPNDLSTYLDDLKNAAHVIGDRYNVPQATINDIINNAAAGLTPPYQKDGNLLNALQINIENALNSDTIVKDNIWGTISTEIFTAIDNVPHPDQPDDGIYSDVYDAQYFKEYKARVWTAAQTAAKAAGLTNMASLDAVFAGVADPTATPITNIDLNNWKASVKQAIGSDTTLQQSCIKVGIDAITTAVNDAREGYGYTLVSTADFAKYKADVLNAAKDAAGATGMPTGNFENLLNGWQPYPDMMLDEKGIGEYLNNQIDNVLNDTGAMMDDVVEYADRNQKISDRINEYWGGLRTTEQQKFMYAWGQAAISKLANGTSLGEYGLGFEKFTLGENLEAQISTKVDAMLSQAISDMKTNVGHMDFAGFTIETQEDAQMALEAIEAAIVQKDKIRAHIGAMQNRLENTITNLNVMAENLQAAESRISDVDVATEMTNMVRNQILSQAATAMLAQANSLPQMAMQLIGG